MEDGGKRREAGGLGQVEELDLVTGRTQTGRARDGKMDMENLGLVRRDTDLATDVLLLGWAVREVVLLRFSLLYLPTSRLLTVG